MHVVGYHFHQYSYLMQLTSQYQVMEKNMMGVLVNGELQFRHHTEFILFQVNHLLGHY